jgi:hypothetical protein
MAKLILHALGTRGWQTVILAAVLVSWGPLETRVFAQGPAARPNAAAPKKAPKSARTKSVKKAAPAKGAKVTPPALPAKEKIQPVTAGLRDPFKQPEAPKVGPEGRIDNEPRPPGPRGLAVGEMVLEGIVREDTNNVMIAVVAGPERRAYFLRINDPVYHATVAKITTDSVYFSETFTDPAGHESTREVVKKMPATGERP